MDFRMTIICPISGLKSFHEKAAAAAPVWVRSRCFIMNQAEPVRIYLFCHQLQVESSICIRTMARSVRAEANIDDITA